MGKMASYQLGRARRGLYGAIHGCSTLAPVPPAGTRQTMGNDGPWPGPRDQDGRKRTRQKQLRTAGCDLECFM